ncbi:MAG: REP-associated tyrosine transposase [Burkholderiaceae bacterium]
MGRPLRIEFPDAVYHVTSRGDRQEPVFRDPTDRRRLLDIVDQAMGRLEAEMFAYCLMGNHYHFVLRTRLPNLSRLMRHINGEYTRSFNRRHQVTGHVFQGRFHAVIVDTDAYLLKVCRYVELNPVRAGLVAAVDQWPWCSYRAHVGTEPAPRWLATAVVHGHLLGHDVGTAADQILAQRLYEETVAAGRGVDLWGQHLHREIYLGGKSFAAEMQARATGQRLRCADIAKAQRTQSRNLAEWLTEERTRDEAFRLAYTRGGMTMPEIARQAGMSVSGISRIIAMAERLHDSRPDTATFKT